MSKNHEEEENKRNWPVQEWTDYAKKGNKDLEGANLEGANLRNADLKGADLEGANLKGHDIDDLRKRVAGF